MPPIEIGSRGASYLRSGDHRQRAVSLFSWSVEQNARDTQMTTRVTEGARRERHDFFSGCLPRYSRLAASPLNARALVYLPYKI